jgi:opacity protein-like surface antigen
MRKILITAWLIFGASAWASGIEFWAIGGETLTSNGNLGTGSCYGDALTGTPSTCAAIVSYQDQYSLGNAWHFGFRGGFNSGEHLGYEVGYMYNRTSFGCSMPSNTPAAYYSCSTVINGASVPVLTSSQGMAYHQVSFNALYYFTGSDAKFRPFVTGGLGFTAYAFPGTSAYYGGASNEVAFNYGGGVKYKLTDRWAARIDVRQSTTPKPSFGGQLQFASGWLRETEISAGFGILF